MATVSLSAKMAQTITSCAQQKPSTDLADVKGTCPESPRLSGTYNIAGIANWAHTTDIRTDVGTDKGPGGGDSEQKINTYSVALNSSSPSIVVPVPGSATGETVSILPACRNLTLTPDANCALVDFKVTVPDDGSGTATFYVNWEDSEQGGDYDQDMQGTLSYSITSTEITITTDTLGESTGDQMGFGYVISGTTQDGFHVHSGIKGFNYNDPSTVRDCVDVHATNGCNLADGPQSHTYTFGSSGTSLLKNPLWYAAKYGGFNDIDEDKKPLHSSGTDVEWDQLDEDGNLGADGVPDNFFQVTNPELLERRLGQVFSNIVTGAASGTAAAVVTNNSSGEGLIYQALYFPEEIAESGGVDSTINWGGSLHALFVDNLGQLREDDQNNGTQFKLDGCGIDRIVTLKFNASTKETRVQRYNCDANGARTTAITDPSGEGPMSELQTVWNARDQLSSFGSFDPITQRDYTGDSSATERHIVTAIDTPGGTRWQYPRPYRAPLYTYHLLNRQAIQPFECGGRQRYR